MTTYILNRLALAVPTLLAISILVFAALRLVPGDPVQNQIGLDYDPAVRDQLRSEYGLDQPLPAQYAKWLGHFVRGDWGASMFTHRAVLPEIIHRVPISIEIGLLSIATAFLIAIPVGTFAALNRGKRLDFGLMSFTVLGVSAPEFLIGVLLIYVFSLRLGWLDATGFRRLEEDPVANLRALILPVISLGFARAALLTRLIRAELIEVLSQDYVRTARAKGLRYRVIVLRHALKNALIPVVTILGLQVGAILGGSVVVESLFVIPGIGTYGIDALRKRDYPVVQGFVLFIAVGFVLANLLVDIAYGWLDPRIRYRKG
jgi:peptide/nickel transport system permease protein